MKNPKRIIASLAICLALTSSVSHARDYSLLTDVQQEDIKAIEITGIMSGTTNGFEPGKNLTRAEAATIMTRLKDIDKSETDELKTKKIFKDVERGSWASGYINKANEIGLVKGMKDGTFAPNSNVTVEQFKTMAIRALGAGSYVDSQGKWPDNYLKVAKYHGIGLDVNAKDKDYITRADAAVIIIDTLESDIWDEDWQWNHSMLEETFGIIPNTIEIASVDKVNKSVEYTISYDNEMVYDIDENLKTMYIPSNIDINHFVEDGYYEVWYKKNDDKNEMIFLKEDTYNMVSTFFQKGYNISTDSVVEDGKLRLGNYEGDIFEFPVNISRYPSNYFNKESGKNYYGCIECYDGSVSLLKFDMYDTVSKIKTIEDMGEYLKVSFTSDREPLKVGKNKESLDLVEGDFIYYYYDKENDKDIYRIESKVYKDTFILYDVINDKNGKEWQDSIREDITVSDINNDLEVDETWFKLGVDENDFEMKYQTINNAKKYFSECSIYKEVATIYVVYDALDGYRFIDIPYVFGEIKGAKPNVMLKDSRRLVLEYKVILE